MTAPRPVGVGLEEPTTTRVERFLAVVLAVFVLIGLLWVYAQPLDRTDDLAYAPVPVTAPALVARDQAREQVLAAEERVRQAQAAEETARENYRTKLDAGQPAGPELQAFTAAQDATREAREAAKTAQVRFEELVPAAEKAEQEQGRASEQDRRRTVLLRLGLVLGTLLASYALFEALRRRGSRYLQSGMAAIGAAVGLAVVMAGDYLDVREVGPIVLSLAGVAVTVAASVAYQRYLAARLPARRVRKGECPFCGYPARGGAHCEGCGRGVLGACATCGQQRRVAARYCSECGEP